MRKHAGSDSSLDSIDSGNGDKQNFTSVNKILEATDPSATADTHVPPPVIEKHSSTEVP